LSSCEDNEPIINNYKLKSKVFQDGRPHPGVQVSIEDWQAVSNEEGVFELSGIPAGEFEIKYYKEFGTD